jgi:hypothetical protein
MSIAANVKKLPDLCLKKVKNQACVGILVQKTAFFGLKSRFFRRQELPHTVL